MKVLGNWMEVNDYHFDKYGSNTAPDIISPKRV